MRMPDFSTRRRVSRPGQGETWLLGAALVATVVSAYEASSAWAWRGAARGALAAARHEAEALDSRRRSLERRGGTSGDALASQIRLTEDAPPSRVMAEIAALLPPDARLEGVTLRYGRRLALDMQVVGRSAPAYDLFLKRLAESPSFEEVVPGAETREGQVQASVQALYRPGGRP
ncbi:MAG: hypothetical protein HY317_00415 [Acidobacteria bacterium]|nr:hypothetical protein [Acidobacteriota bacterium]